MTDLIPAGGNAFTNTGRTTGCDAPLPSQAGEHENARCSRVVRNKKTVIQIRNPDETYVTIAEYPGVLLTPGAGLKLTIDGIVFRALGQRSVDITAAGLLSVDVTSTFTVEPE